MNQKKINFISVMLLAVGATIGSGIFFKNSSILDYTGSIVFSLFSWVVSVFAIVCICLTLKEIVRDSGQNNSMGNIGWIKSFCSTRFYNGFRNFMIFLYIPTNFFILVFYGVQSIQDSLTIFLGEQFQLRYYYVILIAFFCLLFFTFVPMFFSKFGIVQNNILSITKFLPLLFGIVAGIVVFSINKASLANNLIDINLPPQTEPKPFSLSHISPFIGIIASIPAIFFAFDGFYVAGSVMNEMEKPEKFSKALALGIIVVAVVYILFSISMLFVSEGGSFIELVNKWESDNNAIKVIKFLLLLCIALACFGVVNSWSIFCFTFFKELIQKKETIWHNRFNHNSKYSVILYNAILIISTFFVFTLIGCFFYHDGPYAATTHYDEITKKIFNLCDLISNWTSLFVFLGIIVAIFGYLQKNKNTTKSFKTFAFLAIFFVLLSTLFEVSECFVILISSVSFQIQHANISFGTYLLPSILKFILLFVFFSVCFLAKKDKKELKLNIG
ncbi:MAG: APC family permease [Mycoplasmataceae bacterium]|nr:APC family permease [Mycoplasmataceae bacterium]